MSKYLNKAAAAVATPKQSEPLDERQVRNSAGGFAYPVDCWKRLDRFLILGSEGGSYYASEQKLTKENIKAVAECVKENGVKTVKRIVEISDSGRSYKNDPALLALAYCAGKGDDKTRREALANLSKVARIGTHLFHFIAFAENFRGWGRGMRNAVVEWYLEQDVNRFADQVIKYQQRDGWSNRDLMRLAHPTLSTTNDVARQAVLRWVVKGEQSDGLPERVRGHILLQSCTDAVEAAKLIRQYGLVRESVPTELLKDKRVWAALLEKMPMTAMIRNLGNMSKCGLLVPMSDAVKTVVDAIGNAEALKKARVHPIQLLIAQKTYGQGRGVRGKGEWGVVPQVVDALDDSFYKAFTYMEPTGQRYYLGIDVSGSMGTGNVCGVENFTPREAAAAMAMTVVKLEKQYYSAGFTSSGGWRSRDTGMTELALSPKQRLDDVTRKISDLDFGATDCALPMIDALKKKMPVDVFIVYTDSETWAGTIHPTQALKEYRQKMGIPAKLIVVGMVANEFTIADPNDGGMLDVVGFDASAPQLIGEFAAGKI